MELKLFKDKLQFAEFHFGWRSIRSSPEVVFHYTGNSGLIGIFDTTSFWATDVRYLNDDQEIEIAIDAAKEVIRERLIQARKKHANALGKIALSELEVQRGAHYVFSLTENGDSLSQWRGYCKESSGFSVGFKFEKIQEWCVENGLSLSNVIYGTVALVRDLERLLDAYLLELDAYFPYFDEGGVNADLMFILGKRIARKAMRAAPFVKHSGFEDEKEWRIVQYVEDPSKGPIPRYRNGTFSLVPFVEWKFVPQQFYNSLAVVNIKPSDHKQLSSEALKGFAMAQMSRHGISETPMFPTVPSQIPFRPGF